MLLGQQTEKNIREILDIPFEYEIDTVIALGYKAHESFVEDNDETVRYYLDEEGNYHVPKRPLEKKSFILMLSNFFVLKV